MSGNEISSYCHDIESYLCQKNDGHLIRVVGPSFELVSRWAADGVPLKIAFRGIDRYFERYYRKGPRRRPVKIDFCEADVLDAFDEWKRATGIVSQDPGRDAGTGAPEAAGGGRRGASLPSHLERVVLKLTSARAAGRVGPAFDVLLDRVAGELDAARGEAHGVRGAARRAALERLAALDAQLLDLARQSIGADDLARLAAEAEQELGAFRATMTAEAFARARDAAIDRLVRDRFNLPVLTFAS